MTEPAPPRIRVLYFAGSGRSGTTVITNILGQVDGAFAAGELRYLWQRGIVENRLCGCGAPFSDCALWRDVLSRAFADLPAPDAQEVAGGLRSRLRIARVPSMLVRRVRGQRPVPAHPHDRAIASTYAALSDATGAGVIIDSSKLPPYGLMLAGLPGVDLYVLHVVRDPRATAFSWRRTKALLDFGDDQLMPRLQLWKSSVLWLGWNALTALLWRHRTGHYLRVRYEDFVRSPEETMRRVVEMVGLDPQTLPFTTPTAVQIQPTHSVAGNPSRHHTGEVEVSADNEWQRAMPVLARVAVTMLTAPGLRGFGYALRPGNR